MAGGQGSKGAGEQGGRGARGAGEQGSRGARGAGGQRSRGAEEREAGGRREKVEGLAGQASPATTWAMMAKTAGMAMPIIGVAASFRSIKSPDLDQSSLPSASRRLFNQRAQSSTTSSQAAYALGRKRVALNTSTVHIVRLAPGRILITASIHARSGDEDSSSNIPETVRLTNQTGVVRIGFRVSHPAIRDRSRSTPLAIRIEPMIAGMKNIGTHMNRHSSPISSPPHWPTPVGCSMTHR